MHCITLVSYFYYNLVISVWIGDFYTLVLSCIAGADPGFDRGGGPDHDRPKTAILGPQFCRILVLGPHFWWSGGAQAPGPPRSAPAL